MVARRATFLATATTLYLLTSSFPSQNHHLCALAFVQPTTVIVRPSNYNNNLPSMYQYSNHRTTTSSCSKVPRGRINVSHLHMSSSTNGEGTNGSSSTNGELKDKYPMEPQVYPQRWTQLVYLSLLALLSDWICFSVAASPDSFEAAYPGSSAANLIDIFLFTNVASCFLVTDVVSKFGLEMSIKGAAGIMTVGCLLRSGIPDLTWLNNFGISGLGSTIANAASDIYTGSSDLVDMVPNEVMEVLPDSVTNLVDPSTLTEAARTAGLEPYALLVLGTILVGFAQPYFQCTPVSMGAFLC